MFSSTGTILSKTLQYKLIHFIPLLDYYILGSLDQISLDNQKNQLRQRKIQNLDNRYSNYRGLTRDSSVNEQLLPPPPPSEEFYKALSKVTGKGSVDNSAGQSPGKLRFLKFDKFFML